MSDFDFEGSCSNGKLAVLDQGALIDGAFLDHVFDFGIAKVLIAREGETLAAVVKQTRSEALEKIAARKVSVLPYEIVLTANPNLFLAGVVRMATEGKKSLALEVSIDGSKYLLLSPSTEVYSPDCDHVVIVEGTNQMRIGYQLYLGSITGNQNCSSEQILNYNAFVDKEFERMSL